MRVIFPQRIFAKNLKKENFAECPFEVLDLEPMATKPSLIATETEVAIILAQRMFPNYGTD
jgi:hypothetical protein